MANLWIQLTWNPDTGKRDILVKLESDPDALPHEHEEQHKKLVNRLIEGGVLSAAEVGEIVVERIDPEPTRPVDRIEESGQSERRAISTGGGA
ncbi:hypothetical protein Isop_0542 [Isosphaera pallida ATCC 43644]|jgi:hypothetical protein|uniref:FtsH ternary system domain-containing protein n=1 Tax=Isosphaera pallida (strain ATCC 43644 / DSM 9630 / IS1B) TaxID=575540 RepID=E8R017_ISOPI|nr:hypothetical protein [Isosphaera pallida]ADV61135.1 hypothetical protein Isop_0542 [Isosphaera pallida ATCC 43644]